MIEKLSGVNMVQVSLNFTIKIMLIQLSREGEEKERMKEKFRL